MDFSQNRFHPKCPVQRSGVPVRGHPPLPAGHEGTAPRVSPTGRAGAHPPRLAAQRCRPGHRGAWERHLPARRTARDPVRGSPRQGPGGRPATAGSAADEARRAAHRGAASRDRGRGWEREGAPVSRPLHVKRRAARPWRGEEVGRIHGVAGKGCAELRHSEGHEDTSVERSAGLGVPALPCPPQPGRHPSGTANSPSPLRSPALRGEPRPPWEHPRPHRKEPAGKSAPYLEEGTDLVLLQVGLDPGLLVRRHEEVRRRGLELVSPGGGCSPSGCSRLTPPPPKGCHSGSGGRCCEGAAARSPRDGANSGERGTAGWVPVARSPRRGAAAGCVPSGSSGRALPGAEHGAGRRRAAKAAPCVCVSTRVPGSALVTGTAAAGAAALATARLPKPMARGSCQRRRRWRPLTPGLRRTKGVSEGRGRRSRAGGRRGLLCFLPPRRLHAHPGMSLHGGGVEFLLSGVFPGPPPGCAVLAGSSRERGV